jgi:hypothetical protein
MEQQELVSAFEDGSVVGPVVRIDTHLSHVFLTPDRAFKLKRAVRLPFVDFTSLERRQAACEAELEVNRRFAGSLYLGALPITRSDEGFAIAGSGPVVDWVVAMRRFDQRDQFDNLAAAGELTVVLAKRTAEAVADAHARAPTVFTAGHAADYRHVIRALQATETDGAQKLGLEPASSPLFEQLDIELTRIDRFIEARRKQGKVRRGHGDLHLRNICLFEGEPTPFDALEFDERLATTDVLYDLAFLIMDMRRVGLAAQSNAVMNAYWDAAGEDEAALDLLPFFMSLRAAVRMAVAVEAAKLEEAHRYRQLGLELLAPAPARLMAIGGLSGVGKSAVAEALAPMLPGPAGARLLRSDVLRKRMLGLPLAERAQDSAYAPERQAEVYEELGVRAQDALASHASVVADATFRTSLQRELIGRAAHGAAFNGYWLQTPLHIRLQRVAQRIGDASDADLKVAAEQKEPSDLPASWRTLDASASSPAELADVIRSDFPLAGDTQRPH